MFDTPVQTSLPKDGDLPQNGYNMYIKRVKLENFKRHVSFEGTFFPGTNAICGPNGAGKTSLVEAIGFALFNHRSTKVSELLRKGARRATIIVEFEAAADGRDYIVERRITQRGGGHYAVHDLETGSLMAQGAGESQSVLQDLMQLDPNIELPQLFETTLGVPQGTLTSAFRQTPKDRKKTFYPLLRVEEYQSAYDKMREFLNQLKNRLSELKGKLESRLEQLEQLPEKEQQEQILRKETEALEVEHTQLEARKPQLVEQLDKLNEQQEQLRKQTQKLDKNQERLQRFRSEQRTAMRDFEEAKTSHKIVEAVKQDAKQHEEARKADKTLRQQQRDAKTVQEEISKLTLQAQSLAQSLETQTKEVQKLEALEAENTSLAAQVETQTKLEAQLEQLRKETLQWQEAKTRLKREESALEELKKEQSVRQTKVEELRKLQPKVEEKEQIGTKGKEISDRIEQIEKQDKERLAIAQRLEDFDKEFTAFEASLKADEEKHKTLLDTHQPIAKDLPQLETKLNTCQRELGALEAQIEREEQFSKDVSGGVCPFFKQPCLNLPEGQNLEQHLGNTLQKAQETRTQRKKDWDTLEKQIQHAKTSRNILQTDGEKLKIQLEEKHKLLEQKKQQRAEIVKTLEAFPDNKKELEELGKQRHQLREDYKVLHQLTKEAEKLPVEEGLYQRLQQDLTKRQQHVEQLQQQISSLSNAEAQIPPIEASLKELGNPREKVRFNQSQLKALPTLQKTLTQTQTKQTSCQSRLDTLAEKRKDFETLDAKLQEVSEQLQRTEEAYQKHLQHKHAAEKLPASERRLKEIETSLRQTEALVEELKESIKPLQEAFQPEQMKTLQDEFEALKQRSTQLNVLLPEKKERLSTLSKDIERLQLLRTEVAEQQGQCNRLKEVIDCCELTRKVYNEAGPRVTRALIGSISQEANRIFRHLMDQNRLHLRWSEDFELFVEEEGIERSFANLSGGEQMSAALAIRLAFVRELSSVRIAFFDEPTAHMDAERRHNLATQLMDINGFEQLFVISHDDTFESITDHVVWIDREK